MDVGAAFTCEGHAGTWTWFGRHAVNQVRCNADRCETHVSDQFQLSWDVGGPLYAADLGGRALVLDDFLRERNARSFHALQNILRRA